MFLKRSPADKELAHPAALTGRLQQFKWFHLFDYETYKIISIFRRFFDITVHGEWGTPDFSRLLQEHTRLYTTLHGEVYMENLFDSSVTVSLVILQRMPPMLQEADSVAASLERYIAYSPVAGFSPPLEDYYD